MSDFEDYQQPPHEDDFEPLDGGIGAGDQHQKPEPSAPPPPPSATTPADPAPPAVACGSGDDGRMLLCCSYLERADPHLKFLLLWSDPKRSAAVLFSSLTLLWACMAQSFVSVLAYLGLSALLCTCALRLYAYTLKRGGAGAVGSPEVQHELLACLQEPVRLPRQCMRDCVDRQLDRLERNANCLRDLLLFRDSMRTLKFFCCLIALTYVGSWFNALTLLSLAVVSAFCLPKAYSVYHRQVDAALAQALDRYRHVNVAIRAAIPFGKEKKN